MFKPHLTTALSCWRANRFRYLVIALLAITGASLLYSYAPSRTIFLPHAAVVIEALGERNEASLDTEVWIHGFGPAGDASELRNGRRLPDGSDEGPFFCHTAINRHALHGQGTSMVVCRSYLESIRTLAEHE